MQNNLVALIMAGGSGERFWPLSTKEKPKQLIKLINPESSLLQMTVERISPLLPLSQIFIATNALQAPAVLEQLPGLPPSNIIIEPSFKDTAAAIGFASVIVSKQFPNCTMVVLASDHLIDDNQLFRKVLEKGAQIAQQEGAIVTLGITPTHPETGYGYLEIEEANKDRDSIYATAVKQFCEKPPYETALNYFNSKRYLWNSGIFIFKIEVIMDAFKRLMPSHYSILSQISTLGNEAREPSSTKLIELFNMFQKISIDFGVMEKFEKIVTIPSNFGWNDVGSFSALADIFPLNANGSVVSGTTIREIDSSENIVVSTTGKRVSIVGASNLIIVESENELLICSKEEAQKIKELSKN